MLFSRVFATHKSRPALPAPLPFTLSSRSSLFFSEVCSLFSVTTVSQPFVYQSLRHSFHRDGACTLCSIIQLFVYQTRPFRPLPLRAPKSRRINTCKSLSKQRTLVSFRMIDLQKTGGRGVLWLTKLFAKNTRSMERATIAPRSESLGDCEPIAHHPRFLVFHLSTFNFRLSTTSPVTSHPSCCPKPNTAPPSPMHIIIGPSPCSPSGDCSFA